MNKFPPKKIAVAFDHSAPSVAALNTAKGLARHWDAFLDIIYVFEMPPTYGHAGEVILISPAQCEEHKETMRDNIKKLMANFKSDGYEIHVLEGGASAAVDKWVNTQDTDLLVTGTHGYTGILHILFGSVAGSIVAESHVPVLTVHADRPLNVPNRVLLPFNQESYAEGALAAGLKWCEDFKAHATIFQAVEKKKDEAPTEVKLKERVAPFIEKQNLIHPDVIVRSGDPIRSILEAAKFGNYDLVVLAAHHKNFWKDLVLGMTTERVLRLSDTPLLSFISSESNSE